jgi:F0F1-type ATP synthase assembly protein I
MPGSSNKTPNPLVQVETILQVALALPVGAMLGWLFGDWLDHRFHQHWIAITGLFLGASGGFIQLFTTLNRISKRGDQ